MKQSYTINIINGEEVFISAKTGKRLTGAAKVACEKAEAEREQKALDEIVDNALILSWYEENAIEIDAEQQRNIARANNQRVHGEGFVLTNTATVTVWPSAFGKGFTRAQAHRWLAEIRAKRHAERHANMKRSNNTAHKTNNHAVEYVARRIFGGKAMREGRRVHVVFTRKIYTLKSLAWKGLPPRACGKIGVVKDGNTFKAWAFAGMYNNAPLWILTKVYAGLNFPVVLDITKKGGDDNTPKGDDKTTDDKAAYEAFCDALDAIIHDKKEETPKRIAITGWALTETMLRNLETAYEDEDVREALTHIFRKLTAQFARNALACLGWKYNADRGMMKGAVIDFLRKRDTEKFPIMTPARYDITSTVTAIQAINRCMLHAKKNSKTASITDKRTRPTLARLCRKFIQGMQPNAD